MLYYDNIVDMQNHVFKYKLIPEKAEGFCAVFNRLFDNFIMSVNTGDMVASVANILPLYKEAGKSMKVRNSHRRLTSTSEEQGQAEMCLKCMQSYKAHV